MIHDRVFKLSLPFILVFGLTMAARVKADLITVVNAGFEDPSLPGIGAYTMAPATIPGWIQSDSDEGVYWPTSNAYVGGAPQGNNIAYSDGGSNPKP